MDNSNINKDGRVYLLRHKMSVSNFMKKLSNIIIERSKTHDSDSSNLSKNSNDLYANISKLSDLKYDSKDFIETLKEEYEVLETHYENNSHHPEHYENGIKDMDLIDIIEMICDWKSIMNQGSIDIDEFLSTSQSKYSYSDELKSILRNTIIRHLN